MKAAVVSAPGKLEVWDVPDPRPGEYEALCRLEFGATCTGTDTHIIDGVFPFSAPLPTILGHESVGRVLELGPKAGALRVGDLVTRVGSPAFPERGISVTWGGFAEYGIARDHWSMRRDGLPASSWSGARVNRILHPAVRPQDAPMFTTWRETLSYVRRVGVTAGATVLIIGSGGNGLSFACHARELGAGLVVMVGSAALEERARRAGVTHYLDYRSTELAEELRTVCPSGVEFLIDAVGKRASADVGLPLLCRGGTVGVYGVDDYGSIGLGLSRARSSFRVYAGGYDESETHQEVTDLYLSGRLDASIWYQQEDAVPLEQIGKAFDAVRRRVSPKALVRLSG